MSAKPPKTPPTVRERTTNFLFYGFGLSILLHLIVGPFVHFERTAEAPETVEKVRIDKMPTPPPTPKPTPKPTPTPPPTPPPKKETPPPSTPQPEQPKLKVTTQKTTAHSGGKTEAANTHTTGTSEGVPAGTTTGPPVPVPVATAPPAPPTPVPTPTPLACAVPNADARTLNAAQPETPPLAQQQGITGTVTVSVSLDENSKLVDAHVAKSPSALLNNAALQAARSSTFKTRVVACKPVADTYNFIVDFQSQ